jgi:hypothetical protein
VRAFGTISVGTDDVADAQFLRFVELAAALVAFANVECQVAAHP